MLFVFNYALDLSNLILSSIQYSWFPMGTNGLNDTLNVYVNASTRMGLLISTNNPC